MRQYIEFYQLLLLLIIAAILIYFFPLSISRLAFLVVLPLAWRSKKDYFWLAFIFVMLDYPGGFFHGGTREDVFRLPLYSILPGISFSIQELFFILMFIKVVTKKQYRKINPITFFKKEIQMLALLFGILIISSPFLGMSPESIRMTYKIAISLSIVYTICLSIYSKEQLFSFLKVIFPFAFIAILLIFYSLANQQQLIALVKSGITHTQGIFNVKGEIDRPIEMVHTLFICFTGSLFLLTYTKHHFNRYYLAIINLISFLGIFLTGTRSWFLAFCSGYILYLVCNLGRAKKRLKFTLILPIVILGLLVIPIFRNQVKAAWSRLGTIESIFEENPSSSKTIERFIVRAPIVMEGFWSSTVVLGAGFSDHYFKYADAHVGYQNILLNSGIIGALVFFLVIAKLIVFPSRIAKSRFQLSKAYLKMSMAPLILLLVINTATQTIGFIFPMDRVFLMGFSIILIGVSIKIAYLENSNSRIVSKPPNGNSQVFL